MLGKFASMWQNQVLRIRTFWNFFSWVFWSTVDWLHEYGTCGYGGLTVFTKIFNCHHLTPGHFCHPRKKYPGPTSSHSAFPFCPWQPQLYFWFLWIYLLWTFHIGGIKQCVVFVTGFFHVTFSRFICVVAHITFIHFYILFICSSVDGSFGTQRIRLLWTFMLSSLFECVFLFLLGK